MWSFIKGVFGAGQNGSDNVMKVASGIGGWIDGLKLTDQEKQEFQGEMAKHYSDFMASTVSENTERSRTRRDIALWIIKLEAFFLVFSLVAFKLDPAWAKYAYQIATDSPWGYLTLGVGAFFFGAHLVRAAKNQDEKIK